MTRATSAPLPSSTILTAEICCSTQGSSPLADGFVRDDGSTADYLVMRPAGSELRFIDGALGSVLMRTQPEAGYGTHPRPDALIDGLAATATRDEVRAAFGEPEANAAAWDRFEVEGGSLHCKYVDDRIGRVTVMCDVPR